MRTISSFFNGETYEGWINLDELKWENAGKHDLLIAGHMINKPELLFDKIEDDEISRQIDKLLATKKANEEADAKTIPEKNLLLSMIFPE